MNLHPFPFANLDENRGFVGSLRPGVKGVARRNHEAAFIAWAGRATGQYGKVHVQANSPDIWFPVVEVGNIREYKYHVLADVFHKIEYDDQGDYKSKSYYLKVEIHSKEYIENRIYGLDAAIRTGMTYTGMAAVGMTYTIQKRLPLSQFVDMFGDLQDWAENKLGEFLVVPVPGPRSSKEVYGRSSYGEDLKSVCKALINRHIMREQVLNKHSDPNMIGPKGMFDTYDPVTQKPVIRLGGQYLQYRWDPGMQPPDVHYLEFNQLKAYMDAVQQAINELKRNFLDLAEIPPASLAGSEEFQTARVSGIAYRLMMQPLVDKVKRISKDLEPRAKWVLSLAGKLSGVEYDDIVIDFADPFTKIPIEEQQRVSGLFLSKLISRKTGLRELGYTEEQIEKIEEEMAAEEQQMEIKIPSPFGFEGIHNG